MSAAGLGERIARLPQRFRKPEYTGENRCVPCTVLNLTIAALVTAGAWVVTPWLAPILAVPMLAAIYLRGYLIPGTPTLTKRYFPDWILRHFDHHDVAAPTDDEFDAETFLLETGVLVDDREGTDAHIDPTFVDRWTDHYGEIDDAATDVELLAALVDVDPDRIDIESYESGFDAYLDDRMLGQWESRVAFLSDVAAEDLIAERTGIWDALEIHQRSNALGVLRLFVEQCPACSGDVVLESEKKQSCCREYDVIATTCEGCDARLFEAPYDPASVETVEAAG